VVSDPLYHCTADNVVCIGGLSAVVE